MRSVSGGCFGGGLGGVVLSACVFAAAVGGEAFGQSGITVEQQAPSSLRMDGACLEWNRVPPVAIDPAGDVEAGELDIRTVWLANRASTLFGSIELEQMVNLQSGPPEEGSLQMVIGVEGGERVHVDFRGREVWVEGTDGSRRDSHWSALGWLSLPTHASDQFEFRLDLSTFGVDPGDEVTVGFEGSDSLSGGVRFRFGITELALEPRPIGGPGLERGAGAALRIAAFNTLRNGLLSPTEPARREKVGRVIDAIGADVYCLQEEWDASADSIRRRLEGIDPVEDGSGWSVVFSGGTAVASRYPVVALPEVPGLRASGAVVRYGPDESDAMVVYSVHFKCCGHIGSEEDRARLREVRLLIDQIRDLREGLLGEELSSYSDAPVVVAGDYNLVGSRTPLTMLEGELGGSAFELPHLLTDQLYTWYDEGSSFAPGILDYVTASGDVELVKGFTVNVRRLGPVIAREMGMHRADFEASDHMMLVADVAVRR